ncbi:matrixin family metalloprotease [Arthrobacter sp. MDT1-65]
MPVVGLAEVLVSPIFSNSQRTIAKEFGPAAQKAGRDAGKSLGKGINEGVASETDGLEAEVLRLGKAVSKASDQVTASKTRMSAASEAENKALASLRIAELKLSEVRENSRAKASQVAAAEERVSAARSRAATTATARETAERNLSRATRDHTRAQEDSSRASADLESNMRRVSAEAVNSERSVGRLSNLLNRSFRGRPLAEVAASIRDDTQRISGDLSKMAQNSSQQGNRMGRAVTRGFLLVSAGLTTITPAAGAAGAALLAASGSVLTLGSSLKQLGGVAALAPAGLIAIAAGAGVLRTAFDGVGDALKTATEESGKAAGNAALDAMALADAARGVARAEQDASEQRVEAARGVADAEKRAGEVQADSARRVQDARRELGQVVERVAEQQADAARRVADAERDVERTNRRVTESQVALNDARAEAVERVRDLSRSLEGAGLNEREATIRYREAIAAFKAGFADEDSTAEDMERLRLDLDQASFSLRNAQEETAELKKEQAQAAKDGVKGNKQVLSAEQDLSDAREAATDAVRSREEAVQDAVKVERQGAAQIVEAQASIAEASADAAEAQAEAALAVSDAVADAARVQADSAESVADAHRSLERVQLQQADAAAEASEKSVTAMGKLTPAAQAAVTALLGVYEQLGNIRRIAQENFFTGFTGPLLALAGTVLPQLATGVGAIASAFGAGAQQAMGSLSSGLGGGVLEGLLNGVAASITILNGALDPLIQSFITLGVVGMDYMPVFAGAIRDAALEFNTFIQGAAADGSLRGWIDAGIQGFQDLGSILGSTIDIFGALSAAAVTGGINTTLGSVADALDRIQSVMEGPVFQQTMSTIFAGAAAGAEGLRAALGPIGEAFRTGAPALAEFLRLGGEIAGMFIGGIFSAFSDPTFGAGLTTFMEALKRGVGEIAPLLPGLMSALGEVLVAIAPIVEALGPTIVEVITIFAGALASVIEVLSPLLVAMADSPLIVGLFIAAVSASAVISALAMFAVNLGKISGGFKLLSRAIPLLFNPIGLAIAAVAALMAIVGTLSYKFFTETEAGKRFIRSFGDVLLQVFAGVKFWFSDIFLPGVLGVLTRFREGFRSSKEFVVARMEEIRSGISSKVNAVKGFFTSLGDALGKVPGAFKSMVDGALDEFDKLKESAKKPIRFVVDTVIGGMVDTFNGIPGVNITKPKLPKGFYNGGYTGDIDPHRAAGIVHGKEFVFTAAQTAAIGKENLASMAHSAVRGKAGAAASVGEGNMGGFFEGNAASIREHGAYYMSVASGMDGWNFGGAARLWDGAAGVKVKTGMGKKQGHVFPRERGGGILGYTTGTDIDMSPSWMGQLGPKQRLTVAAHEVGHALGLPHNSLRSIMQPNLGNMAATPTAVDVRNLQRLYPGGSGKAGEGSVENPFNGLVDKLMGAFKAKFPGGGMFVDAAGGLAKSGIGQVVKWIDDIKNGIKNIAGNVVDSIKGFFGGGAATVTPNLYDQGGVLPMGMSQVLNQTGQPEAILNPQQWRDISVLAARGSSSAGDVKIYGNVGWMPDQVAREIEVVRRRNQTMSGMDGVVFV